MIRTYLTSAIAGTIALALATAAFAATGEFDNMCSWGLANEQKVDTDCSVNTTTEDKTYCFSSEDAKAQFMENPDANLEKAKAHYSKIQG